MTDSMTGKRRLATLTAMMALLLGLSIPVMAYQDEAPAEPAEPAASEATDAAPATTEDASGEDVPPPPESFLAMLIRANGWVFGPIFLVLSVVLVALVLINTMQIRRDNLIPASFVEEFEQKLASKDYQGAYEFARSDDSFVARVLAAGLSRLNRGYEEAVEGMQEVGEEENMSIDHRLSYLALIGTISPMLGLLGTVTGMVAAFQVIARSTTQPKPAELADGISTALVTTLEGLVIALPAMIAYSLLRNRAQRYVLEVGMVSDGLMQRFSTLGKSKSAAVAPQPEA